MFCCDVAIRSTEARFLQVRPTFHETSQGNRGRVSLIYCGISGIDGRVSWNEKFSFSFATREWNSLTRLRMTIMKSHAFREDSSIGETTYRSPQTPTPAVFISRRIRHWTGNLCCRIHLGGVLGEGRRRGCVELNPSLYNVVLPDGTYDGEIRIGLKFTSDVRAAPPLTRLQEIESNR